MSQYIINNSSNSLNTTNSFNKVWNNYTFADDQSQLLTWLSPLEPSLRHCDIRERRVTGIGQWLTQTEEFGRWCGFRGEGEGDSAVLFCYGNPGVGKTFIRLQGLPPRRVNKVIVLTRRDGSSLVVDGLRDQARGQNIAVSCFYFDFAARKEQSATSMLGSVVKQMVSGMERIPEDVSWAFQEQKKTIGGCRPQLVDITKMLQAITTSQPTFICIDALDECEGVQRGRILGSLRQILEKSPGTRIFMTGRPHIRAEIEKHLAGRVISVPVGARKDDIVTYLRARLDEDETPDAMDNKLEADILKKIPETISEMFLLGSLNIETILQESTIYRRRERLNRITAGLGLDGAYGATIERIKAQGGDKSRLGMAALMWISHAERPLKAEELSQALAVELGSTDFNADNAPSISTLVGCCQGLITVDKEGSTVRLIHFTLQEYLSAHPDIFDRPHSTIAEICLTYLNSQQVKALSAQPFPTAQVTDFLEYCSLYWGAHLKKEFSDCAKSLALALFMECDAHISLKLLTKKHMFLTFDDFDDCEDDDFGFRFNGLHCASLFGICDLVAAFIETEWYDINEGDFREYTPLARAAEYGHEEVVKMLLESEEVNPNEPNVYGITPLGRAAEKGHEGVVKILLSHEEVDPDKSDEEGRAPLMHAVEMKRGGVVKLLLSHEKVHTDKSDDDDLTPLILAAMNGDEGVVKMLLSHEEVDPDKPGLHGQTPLSVAAEYGHEGVVKILLGREEVDPHKPDDGSRTPAAYAAGGGCMEIMKILLPYEGADPDKLETWGPKLLWNAAAGGDEEAAIILLGRQEVNLDERDNYGRTLLSHTAGKGHEGMVRMLLGREEVNPDKPCKEGKTPLSYAARSGHEGVVKILLGREEVNPDKPCNEGMTPLSYAAANGHEGVVKILLERKEVNPDKPSNNGSTPLGWAACFGYERVVEILLGREEVNPDKPDSRGRTPLSRAAVCGQEGVVKILQRREDVNPNKPDKWGLTPLMYATKRSRKNVIALLQPQDKAIALSAS